MTHGRRDDFAEIRAILSQTAQRQAENTVAIAALRQTQAENTVAIAELRQGLSETRRICDSNARSLEAMQSRIDGSFDLHERMMQIALEDRQQWREQRQGLIERYGEIADEQDDTRHSIQNLLEDARADRQASEQARLTIEQNIQNLLEDARADRQANEQARQTFEQNIQTLLKDARTDRLASEREHQAREQERLAFRESIQTFRESLQTWLQEAHAERLVNEQEHKAFREIVRSMLAEIAQIWQRLAS